MLGPIVAIWLLSVGVLVLERDLGTSLLFFGLFVVMLYVATGRTGWIAVGLLLAALGAFAVGPLEPHVHSRVEDWLHPFASIDAGQGPNQLAQSLFAFAAGGLLGTGLGPGPLDPHRLRRQVRLHPGDRGRGARAWPACPRSSSCTRCWWSAATGPGSPARPLRAAARGRPRLDRGAPGVRDRGGVTGLIPLTGMAMPFLAQGGSSVVTNWIIVALLIRISDSARRSQDDDRAHTVTTARRAARR